MVKNCLATIFALLMLAPAAAQKVDVYIQVPSERVKAFASSELDGSTAMAAVDGSGLEGNYHASHNLGHGMWVSQVSAGEVRAAQGTRQGVVWFMAEFDAVEKGIDNIRIWNHNQSQHTARGLRKVYIEYSTDGVKWNVLYNGQHDYFVVPEARGRKQEPASLSIETGGIDLRYLCITADGEEGNHYRNGDPLALRQAEDLHQNIDYYGLSEVAFYRRQKIAASSLPAIENIVFTASQGYLRTPEGAAREFIATFDTPLYTGGRLTLDVSGRRSAVEIAPCPEGITSVTGTFPAGYMEESATATLSFTGRQGAFTGRYEVPGARKWTLYFLPHSHLDIGYTHRQSDVMRLQMRNIDRAMELAERTRDYPEGSRFKWNAEATWPVDGYLTEYAGTPKAEAFVEAARRGEMGLDATLGSILTGISRQEELMHYFDDAHRISKLTGVEINTAMMSDVPGQSWGLVTAMAQNGVRYFSSGPNYVPYLGRLGSHGVGLYNLIWGDVPFWWESQSGGERILYWQTGKGYSMFHGWLMDKLSVCGTDPIWDYLEELELKEYPYGLTYLRYTVHGDNGPPDESMPDVIRQWNEKYESPSFVIGTTKELFTEMERLYGEHLPVYAGDMTPIWEDGAASTARELAMNRETAERLNQSEILWSMMRPAEDFPFEDFYRGWKNTVLFSEHTWGAAGSGPEPESLFTRDVWEGKKAYADSADMISRKIFEDVFTGSVTGCDYVNVVNTELWGRSDVVKVEGVDLAGKILESVDGKKIAVQKLSDGSWIFFAEQLPPLSVTAYKVVKDNRKTTGGTSSMASGNVLDNGRVKVVVDETTGAIRSFTIDQEDYNYASGEGLNAYLYSGRGNESPQTVENIRSITVIDDGEVAATLRIESGAPGCRSLVREVTVYRYIDRVDIINTVDKANVYEHENVRFAFPLNIFNPEVSMDLAMSEMHPEREQLASSNKNFYSVLNGVAVSNIQRGIYLSTIDAPFVELGTPTADMVRLHREGMGWLGSATISPTVYSWAMNNRWRTNYKASQEGVAVFRYSLQAFNPESANLKKYGIEQARKPVAFPSDTACDAGSLFRIRGRNRIALSTILPSADGEGYIVRLQNTGPFTANASIEWGTLRAVGAWYCDNMEKTGRQFDPESFWMKPYDCITIKIITK